jgi:polyhydroxybutyrate depolymerase
MLPCYSAAVIRALSPLCAPLWATLACFVMACSTSSGNNDDATSVSTIAVETPSFATCTPPRDATSGDSTGSITSDGIERAYILHIPPGYDGSQRAPLVMLFHGFSLPSDAFATYTRFNGIADEQNVIVVYPAGQGEPATWNTDQNVTIADDVQFANDLLDKLQQELCVDPDRIFAAGYSNGGAMAQRLACASPERIAAIATIAAVYANCRATVPWVAFHGIDDPRVPFEGGPLPTGGSLQPVRRVVSDWARELGCDPLAQISRPTDSVDLSTYVDCLRGSGEVLLYSLIRAGHTWPGSEDLPVDIAGATSKQIDASTTMWEFFATHPLVQ